MKTTIRRLSLEALEPLCMLSGYTVSIVERHLEFIFQIADPHAVAAAK